MPCIKNWMRYIQTYALSALFLLLMTPWCVAQEPWKSIDSLDSSILVDIRYASKANFVGQQMYPCGRCLLRPDIAKALMSANEQLSKDGYRLKVFDCYRPLAVQHALWTKVPNANYVTPPWKGSNHNRGMAVDVGLADSCGNELWMGSDFDDLSSASHIDRKDLPLIVAERRSILQKAMKAQGFSTIRTEWWHFNHYKKEYPISDSLWSCP